MTRPHRTHTWVWRVAILAALLLAGRPATAQTDVDVALVLAVDASGSVNETRFELQKHGYAAAFRNPRVVEAIAAGSQRRIAVAMVQWTGPSLHALTVDWTFVHDAASAHALADAIDATPRKLFGGGTSLSGAIDYSLALLAKCPCRSPRRTIDVSGDGSNNRGRPAALARDAAVQQGVVINGLPILTLEPDLDAYYRANVIGGPGSFLITVKSYDAFAQAILDKLVTEIAWR
ncbi:MAG TPA: DUF1194 domain-containing protein [Stellaceae bacterium]|nr:DUF1194 domain-containing protein [Stellaceae bacterium]